MRKLIAGMKLSLDEKTGGEDGYADWVEAWSEDYGMTPRIDACLLGGGMYPGYERYWTALNAEPEQPSPMTGKAPTPAEIEWGRLIPRTPHYVLSSTLDSALWPNTRFIRSVDDVAALKRGEGRDIYLVGGGRTTASLIDAGLVDEISLILHPLIAGAGPALFAETHSRRSLELRGVRERPGGLVHLHYAVN